MVAVIDELVSCRVADRRTMPVTSWLPLGSLGLVHVVGPWVVAVHAEKNIRKKKDDTKSVPALGRSDRKAAMAALRKELDAVAGPLALML